jgi:hypothetical protein
MIVRPGREAEGAPAEQRGFANPAIYPDARRDPHPLCSDRGDVMQMLRKLKQLRIRRPQADLETQWDFPRNARRKDRCAVVINR